MYRWNYCTCRVVEDSIPNERELDELGSEGWEAYAVTQEQGTDERGNRATVYTYHLKKRTD